MSTGSSESWEILVSMGLGLDTCCHERSLLVARSLHNKGRLLHNTLCCTPNLHLESDLQVVM